MFREVTARKSISTLNLFSSRLATPSHLHVAMRSSSCVLVLVTLGLLVSAGGWLWRAQLSVPQSVQHGFDERFELLRVLVKDGFLRVVRASIVKDLLDVGAEVIHARVRLHVNLAFDILHLLVAGLLLLLVLCLRTRLALHLPSHVDLLLNGLEVHWMLDDLIVVTDLFFVNGATEGPRVLMLGEHVENFVALFLESSLVCLFFFEIGGIVPSSFSQARDLVKDELFLARCEVQPRVPFESDKLENFLNECLYTKRRWIRHA